MQVEEVFVGDDGVVVHALVDVNHADVFVQVLLKELFSRRGGVGVDLRGRDGHAQRRVPLVVAAGPRQHGVDGRQRRHQVVHRPADDGVVVHAHVDVDHADGVAHTWHNDSIWSKLSLKFKTIICLCLDDP